MINGIIIGHGDFAQTLLSTAERIVGKQTNCDVISNTNLSCEQINDKINSSVGRYKEGEVLIFVDLPGGSCTISCYNVLKTNKEINVICGVNLPILLEFFILRDKYPIDKLIPILINKGKENIFQLKDRI